MRTRPAKKTERKWRKKKETAPPTERREGREREDDLRAASHGEERRAAAGGLDFLARRGRMVEEAARADAIDGDLIVDGGGDGGGVVLPLTRFAEKKSFFNFRGSPLRHAIPLIQLSHDTSSPLDYYSALLC